MVTQQKFCSTLDIEINLRQVSSTKSFMEIKDSGPGIHPKKLMEALTSFGTASGTKSKSNYSFSEHGMGLKVNSFRLAQTTLIISRTKPVYDCGSSTFFISFGLLSTEFMRQAGNSNGLLVAPLISMEIKNKRI